MSDAPDRPPRSRLRNVRPFDGERFAEPRTSKLADITIRDGRIAAIVPAGSSNDSEIPIPREHDHDLDGAWLLPAFVDSHLHLHTMAQQRSVVPLAGNIDPGRVEAELRPRHRDLPSGEWIVAQGWRDPLPERLGPVPRAALDTLVPDRPVWLFAADHHRALLNGAALRACGLLPEEHSGVLQENALMEAWRAVPPLAADIEGTIADLHRHGITAATSFDGPDGRAAWGSAVGEGSYGLRVRHSVPREEFYGDRVSWAVAEAHDHEAPFLVPWVKVFLDGTLGSRTAWLKEDYDDAPGNRGDERVPPDDRAALVEALADTRLSLAIHAIGDAAVATALTMIEGLEAARAARGGVPTLAPHRIEHAQLIDRADLTRIAAAGAVASIQACHLLEDAAVGPERFGDRCAHLFAFRSFLDAGIPVILGSDAPIETADPWVDIDAAVRRVDRAGRFPEGWHPQERVGFAAALRARTSGAASANLLPVGWGRIAVGSPADLQVLTCADPSVVRTIDEAGLAFLLHDGRVVQRAGGP